MAEMDIDEVLDLSLSAGRDSPTITSDAVIDIQTLAQNSSMTITSEPLKYKPRLYKPDESKRSTRRVLRPRTLSKSYTEAPVKIDGRQNNDNDNSASKVDDKEMPLPLPVKVLAPIELEERQNDLQKLQDELRNEDTKLILLIKLKQSQNVMKENLIITPITLNSMASIPVALTEEPLLVTPSIAGLSNNNRNEQQQSVRNFPAILSGSSLPGGATLTVGDSSLLREVCNLPRTCPYLTITPSLTITPTTAPPSGFKHGNAAGTKSNSVSIIPSPNLPQKQHQNQQQLQQPENDLRMTDLTQREEIETSIQRNIAAKLALRRQLEKTLLQIPQQKPTPPEMHLIPNPSNPEFIYLLGLETVVDYIVTKEKKPIPVLPSFRCARCNIDFTPAWKWEKQDNEETKIVCKQCVSNSGKTAFKAEHINRMRQLFNKAFQEEQEYEHRLSILTYPSLFESRSSLPSMPVPATNAQLQHQQNMQHLQQQLQHQLHSASAFGPASATAVMAQLNALKYLSSLGLGNLSNISNINQAAQAAANMQAFQQQLIAASGQGVTSENQQNVLQLTPLLYSCHLAMAQAAAEKTQPSLADIQQATEKQGQYLLEMNQPQTSGSKNNRKNNRKT